MLIFVLSLAPYPQWRLKSLSDFHASADVTNNFCLSHPSETAVDLLDSFIFSQFSIFLFFWNYTKETFHAKKMSSGKKMQGTRGLKLRHMFSGGRLMNHWGELWRWAVHISSGMTCWKKTSCHLKALRLHAGITRKEPLVDVYRGRSFVVISDLKICNSGNLTLETTWGWG